MTRFIKFSQQTIRFILLVSKIHSFILNVWVKEEKVFINSSSSPFLPILLSLSLSFFGSPPFSLCQWDLTPHFLLIYSGRFLLPLFSLRAINITHINLNSTRIHYKLHHGDSYSTCCLSLLPFLIQNSSFEIGERERKRKKKERKIVRVLFVPVPRRKSCFFITWHFLLCLIDFF